eukprot:SAG22_NODE_1043_length_5882_cov_148.833132_7_plen_187_part_00
MAACNMAACNMAACDMAACEMPGCDMPGCAPGCLRYGCDMAAAYTDPAFDRLKQHRRNVWQRAAEKRVGLLPCTSLVLWSCLVAPPPPPPPPALSISSECRRLRREAAAANELADLIAPSQARRKAAAGGGGGNDWVYHMEAMPGSLLLPEENRVRRLLQVRERCLSLWNRKERQRKARLTWTQQL